MCNQFRNKIVSLFQCVVSVYLFDSFEKKFFIFFTTSSLYRQKLTTEVSIYGIISFTVKKIFKLLYQFRMIFFCNISVLVSWQFWEKQFLCIFFIFFITKSLYHQKLTTEVSICRINSFIVKKYLNCFISLKWFFGKLVYYFDSFENFFFL